MRSLLAAALTVIAVAGSIASAQQPAAEPPAFAPPNLTDSGVRSLAASCAICHGTDGRTARGSAVPALAGRQKADLVLAMKQFKDGTRPATIMHQIARGYGEAEIDALAGYFASQAR